MTCSLTMVLKKRHHYCWELVSKGRWRAGDSRAAETSERQIWRSNVIILSGVQRDPSFPAGERAVTRPDLRPAGVSPRGTDAGVEVFMEEEGYGSLSLPSLEYRVCLKYGPDFGLFSRVILICTTCSFFAHKLWKNSFAKGCIYSIPSLFFLQHLLVVLAGRHISVCLLARQINWQHFAFVFDPIFIRMCVDNSSPPKVYYDEFSHLSYVQNISFLSSLPA